MQVFGRRRDQTLHARGRPAFEKRQGTKSRDGEGRRCRGGYGDFAAGSSEWVLKKRANASSVMPAAGQSGIITKPSIHSADVTLDRLEAVLKDGNSLAPCSMAISNRLFLAHLTPLLTPMVTLFAISAGKPLTPGGIVPSIPISGWRVLL